MKKLLTTKIFANEADGVYVEQSMATDGATNFTSPADELTRLRQENALLRAERAEFLEQLHQKDHRIDSLQHQLQHMLRRLFGRSAEKIDPNQLLLFEKVLGDLAPPTYAPGSPAKTESEAGDSVSSESKPNGHGRRRLPTTLPRQKVIHDLPEGEKPCPCCGDMRHVIGQQISEQLDYVPAKLTVIEHVRLKYACRACEAQASESGPQIITAEKPLSPIEKGLAAPGLLSYVIVSKYGDHLPMHRLERILARHGIDIARSTMCDWAAQCADLLKPLHALMAQRVLQSKVIHTDDTPVKVQDRRLDRTRTGRFWVYLGDDEHPYTIFDYTPSRSRDGPLAFLRDWGKDQPVYLQADAFGGYDGIYAGAAGGQVTEVACWAHARRKFYDARTSDAAGSAQALAYIRLLYDVEAEAKKQAAALEKRHTAAASNDVAVQQGASAKTQASEAGNAAPSNAHRATMSAAQDIVSLRCQRAELIRALREAQSVPRLEQFKAWLESQQAARGGPVLPKSPMGQAITYALNQWDALCVYTADGNLAIDNNASENALRRVAIGRKNWLFCGSDNGGKTAAVLFTLIATCQRHKVEPFAYLRKVLTRIAATPANQLDAFLPDRWSPAN